MIEIKDVRDCAGSVWRIVNLIGDGLGEAHTTGRLSAERHQAARVALSDIIAALGVVRTAIDEAEMASNVVPFRKAQP